MRVQRNVLFTANCVPMLTGHARLPARQRAALRSDSALFLHTSLGRVPTCDYFAHLPPRPEDKTDHFIFDLFPNCSLP